MDVNGLRFWMLSEGRDWSLGPAPPALRYDGDRRLLRLASARPLPAAGEDASAAELLVERVPQAIDALGSRAFWDAGTGSIKVTSEDLPGETVLFSPPEGDEPSDLAAGPDGVLFVAFEDRLLLVDPRQRFSPFELAVEGLRPWRLAPLAGGGAWVLDRDNGALVRIEGRPFPDRPDAPYAGTTWRPCPEDPYPLRPVAWVELSPAAGERLVGVAAGPAGEVGVLVWGETGAGSLELLDASGRSPTRHRLLRAAGEDLLRPYSLAWTADDRVALLVSGLAEAAQFEPGAGDGSLLPVGDLAPLRGHDGGPLLNGLLRPAHYPRGPGRSSPLNRLSLPSYALRGEAAGRRPIDSGEAGTVWHRLYLEASIPANCRVVARLTATEEPTPPGSGDPWFEHRFGGAAIDGGSSAGPVGVRVPQPSEIPFHPGLLSCDAERERAGLFTVLVQRSGRRVRSLRGRYLWVRLELSGDGRATPEVAALRAYSSRFSYVENYLPELYRESVFEPDASAEGASTRADFLERYLCNFEGLLSMLEDRIAHSHLLTDPRTAPADSLDWLASWIGTPTDDSFDEPLRRRLLLSSAELSRLHGTLRGLELALDQATDGWVTRGALIVIEDYRLRRTFATILGADLADEEDPLLGGIVTSGNSLVGDTLLLGEEERKEFLALFRADLEVSRREQRAVERLFERLAHRATVIVHEDADELTLGRIRRIVELESPAHVEVRVLTASHPLLVGMASLVGVDTFLRPKPPPRHVRVGRSRIGGGDRILGSPGFDVRLGGGVSVEPGPPTAALAEVGRVELGADFVLDGSGSRAAAGRELVRFNWSRVDGRPG